ncbi:MAG: hypothetical protein ABW352_15320 [Polyangiales bacterium]
MRFLRLLALSIALAGCAAELEGEEEDLDVQEQALSGDSLSSGTRTTIASVIGAENHVFTSTGRLFVTGDKGIYELKKKSDGTFDRIVAAPEQKSPFCQFGGITEARGLLYANCYGVTDSWLFAAKLEPTVSFRSIAMLNGRGLANGLTSDAQGRLYIATTLQNQILRFTTAPSDPFTVSTRETFQNNSGALTNGIKHYEGVIYWSDGAAIKKNTIDRYYSGPPTVVADFAYFDDLHVDASGYLITDYTGNVLRAYDTRGRSTSVSPKSFNGPSSVGRALGRAGLGARTIVVTERGGNRVSIFEPN